MHKKIKHFFYVPFTGLGLYNGFRGNAWLKNRIKVFMHYVVPSLQVQTSRDFTLWISWRPEEKDNKHVKQFIKDLKSTGLDVVHTFHGVCFYDDKYEDKVACARLRDSLHYSISGLFDSIGEVDEVIMTIQPSDDLYDKNTVKTLQYLFTKVTLSNNGTTEDWQAIGFSKGYIMNYPTGQIAEYNPETNPPFYSIKFKKQDFIHPLKHLEYTSLKKDIGKYKKGTPLPSHEYVGDCLKYLQINERGFLVGTHLNNISTGWNIPYKGKEVDKDVLDNFGIQNKNNIRLKTSLRKKILFSLPYKWQRKVRYWLTEKFNVFY